MVLQAEPKLIPVRHPILPSPTREEVLNFISTKEKAARYLDWLDSREKARLAAIDDPYHYGFELDHWKDADRERLGSDLVWLILLGGNRSAKSFYCAARAMKDAMTFPRTFILCIAETERSSIETQQQVVWNYLPRQLKELNGTKDKRRTYYINYSAANGFSDFQLVLPNGSKLVFTTYNAIATDFEGMEFGNKDYRCIGAWPDESMTIPWYQMLDRRLRFLNAVGVWAFTPVKGMTPVIKEAVGSGKIIQTRQSELLPDKVNVEGCPVGHMPYIQEGAAPRTKVMYFFSQWNPFGNSAGPYYNNIKELCQGRPAHYIKRIAYGYTTETTGKAFPLFGPVNVVKPEQLPAEGTNYQFVDPASARNFSAIWIRVTKGFTPNYYVYRDWPDAQTYGEWAMPSERELTEDSKRGWDGEPGPAQNTMNYGANQYKREFKRLEALRDPRLEVDPYRIRMGAKGKKHEEIAARYIDPRAGADEKTALEGGTCLIDMFGQPTQAEDGEILEAMEFIPASGVGQLLGVNAIESLLYWDKNKPFDAVMNSPRLFISSDCHQVLWAINNYTGRSGNMGACKDFIDLLRYMALADLVHIDEGGVVKTDPGGTY